MQTQTQTPDILQQFSDMLKSHSIIVSDRGNLVKLFENIVELCTQMPKTKLKAAIKTATTETKEPKTTKTKTTKAKANANANANPPLKKPIVEELVGPAEAGDCPMLSDLKPVALARGRGRPRKNANATVAIETVASSVSGVDDSVATTATPSATPAGDAEKKKRGRPKKDKSVMISSNEDEDALIAKMISDARAAMKNDELVRAKETTPTETPVADSDETDTDADENSVSPIHIEMVGSQAPIQVEVDVPVPPTTKGKAAKEPKAAKAPKAAKEPKAKASKAAKEPKAKASKAVHEQPDEPVALVAKTSPLPIRENKASSDGKIYLMPTFPRVSFSHSGQTYFRTETDNVYDNLTLELIGVWDHLNHEIITAFDDEEVEELWLSDEE